MPHTEHWFSNSKQTHIYFVFKESTEQQRTVFDHKKIRKEPYSRVTVRSHTFLIMRTDPELLTGNGNQLLPMVTSQLQYIRDITEPDQLVVTENRTG